MVRVKRTTGSRPPYAADDKKITCRLVRRRRRREPGRRGEYEAAFFCRRLAGCCKYTVSRAPVNKGRFATRWPSLLFTIAFKTDATKCQRYHDRPSQLSTHYHRIVVTSQQRITGRARCAAEKIQTFSSSRNNQHMAAKSRTSSSRLQTRRI